ncbi:chemotaxis protein CheW [Herbaspirillum sp. SJZ107]|uniref:chemotaxis protein CheW n=1 Tax=Herbaspirillum sp. SJZ107 TaxID=2572881 RepID=UPI0011508E94|nr:chemotaxis protein CheW [Herbaspirillum sp. SJZ107]TQK07110.1 twitching motility protein PilI [Herbaspirillum sp. SJZ107]
MAGIDVASRSADPAARRTRLRQYQQQLLERVQAARTSSGARANQLGVEIGGVRYLLDLLEAGEIVPVPALTRVPLTQPWYLGLANIRGNLVGVVDLAAYLGQPAAPASAPAGAARIVTLAPALGVPCGLLATRVVGLRDAADMEQVRHPEGDRLIDADGLDWMPLALAELVREERFLQVGL